MVEHVYELECMWDQRLEDELYANNISWDYIQYIRNLVWNWKETGDPDYLDHLIVFCFEHNIPVTQEILQYLASSSKKRLNREYKYRTKKGAIRDESLKNQALLWVMKLVEFCGLTQQQACEKAVAMLHRDYPSCSLRKASSMDKKYLEWKKENSSLIEELKSTRRKKYGHEEWTSKEIAEFIAAFDIELDPQLKGNRRD
ncbi:hypothetical protein ACPV5I_10490 [Vibrio gigantis]|uniref:hypothetical protein n=1 Tax=Vibrio TaxID=662 RepID=UPI002E171DBD|nr:hypothetical protein [Vibrio crassostreae]